MQATRGLFHDGTAEIRKGKIFLNLQARILVTRVVSGERFMSVVRDTPEGKRVYTISAGLLKKGERFGYVCVVNDITDRKKPKKNLS